LGFQNQRIGRETSLPFADEKALSTDEGAVLAEKKRKAREGDGRFGPWM